jgi:hypothetical protein
LPGDERLLTAGNDDVRARWPCVQFAAKATQSRRRDRADTAADKTRYQQQRVTTSPSSSSFDFFLKIPLHCAMMRFFLSFSFIGLYATYF